MLVKMRRDATRDEVAAVEDKLHGLGFKTGKMVGEEITLVGVYGDISKLPVGEIEELAGVEQLIPISRAYKRAAQKGTPDRPIYQTVEIGNVVCGGDELCFISGPCSVESEAQIMEAARLVKEAGGDALRGGVVKYRSSPYSGWEGLRRAGPRARPQGGRPLCQGPGGPRAPPPRRVLRPERRLPLPALGPPDRGRRLARDRHPGPGPSRDARRHHGGRVGRAGRGAPEPADRQVGRLPGPLSGAAPRAGARGAGGVAPPAGAGSAVPARRGGRRST